MFTPSFASLLFACSAPAELTERPAAPSTPRMTGLPAVTEALLADLAAPRHASDGAGAVRILEGPPTIQASTPGQWTFEFTAGPLGIQEGGVLVFQTSAFWGWSPPQLSAPDAPGFSTLIEAPDGLELRPFTPEPHLLVIEVHGRAMAGGETLQLQYQGRADRFAEHGEAFWFGVDGDGDGVRGLLPAPPRVNVTAGPVRQLHLTLPSTARPGQPVRLTVAALDGAGNANPRQPEGGLSLILESTQGLDLQVAAVQLGPDSFATAQVTVTAPTAGIYSVRAMADGATGPALQAESNLMVVSPDATRVLWADLQVHTRMSDGTGSLDQVYRYARDVAGLDVLAVTDHDHWGMQPLDQHPALWQQQLDAAERWHSPGRFVTLPAYEWTSWLYGHRHVLFFSGAPLLLSSLDPATDTPQELWAALAQADAMTLAHHSAGGPVAVDWSIPPDPILEPVTELCSVHGSSESADTPGRIYNFQPGNSVRDQLLKGYQLGLLCSSDGHDGHPGLAQLQAGQGGLAGILAQDNTREAVAEALRARRVFGTNGPRILLGFTLGGVTMGGELPPTALTADQGAEAVVRALGTSQITRAELVRGQQIIPLDLASGQAMSQRVPLTGLKPGEFVYLRVQQSDGGAAWSSPVFVTGAP